MEKYNTSKYMMNGSLLNKLPSEKIKDNLKSYLKET